MYLKSPWTQWTLEGLATGNAIKNISVGDLHAVPVWVPTAERQEQLAGVFEELRAQEMAIAKIQSRQRQAAETAWMKNSLDFDW